MSVVLYLLGAGLLAWSGLMLLQGDAFATLDIATRLAGAGVLAIGLGAITGAIRRLGRIIAGAAGGLPAGDAGEGGLMGVMARGRKAGVAKPAPRPLPRAPAPPRPESAPAPAPAPAPAAETERPAAPVAKPPLREPVAPSVPRPAAPEPRVEAPRGAKDRPPAATPVSAAFEPPVVVAPMLGGLAAPQPARPEPPAASVVRERDDAPEASEKIEIEAASPPAPEPQPAAAVAETETETETETAAKTSPAEPKLAETSSPAPVEAPAQAEPPAGAVAGAKRASPPEWLIRARERREARARAERKEPRLDVPPPPEPEEPAAEPETVAPAEEAAEAEAAAAGPRLVREGELKGVTYRFFDDGSVEAESPHGRRRFGSVEELRKTVLAARGGVFDPADEPEGIEETGESVVAQPENDDDRPRFRSAPEEPPPLSAGPADRLSEDPLDAAIAELEQGAPRLRR
ncbi:hypothetical protein [Hansschlegelia sp.]|uniref:hypothetical protein n=1 Tax=Hansschlegelia sp. TaxID=2041892 RepID=UPI002B7C4BC7|nr:hypothetical protein [Hansschlegelia sp.]HVI28136.1 hypothetical protein [Hansschlegelia sp.]